MKKSVYSQTLIGTKSKVDIELLCDIGRELTPTDHKNIMIAIGNLVMKLKEESMRLDPEVVELSLQQRLNFINVFGSRVIYVEEVPNEYALTYWGNFYPWFVVTTHKGRIKIGWRKRVINIDWSDSIIEETSEELFPDEDTTKYEKYIHAWGYEKAREYIDKLLRE